jgi:hypothetical protein
MWSRSVLVVWVATMTGGCFAKDFEVATGEAPQPAVRDLGAHAEVSGDAILDDADLRVSLVVPDPILLGETVIVWASYAEDKALAQVHDQRNNLYSFDVMNNGSCVASTRVTHPLEPNDVITAEFAGMPAYSIRLIGAAAFSGLRADNRVDGVAANTGAEPVVASGSVQTKQAHDLLIGLLSADGDAVPFKIGGGFEELKPVTGHNVGYQTLRRTFQFVSTAGAYSAGGALDADAGNHPWTAEIVAYKAAAP